jgi:hypothetical protein
VDSEVVLTNRSKSDESSSTGWTDAGRAIEWFLGERNTIVFDMRADSKEVNS